MEANSPHETQNPVKFVMEICCLVKKKKATPLSTHPHKYGRREFFCPSVLEGLLTFRMFRGIMNIKWKTLKYHVKSPEGNHYAACRRY